ncbi:Gfo/Idh/MocA family protein [Actinophytocola gossypii]|uniref:Gfo/Idh/MocA family oxidoreductase n=1 Tax=Actinophytocola gossypii TaxID=2812003 RepID=A0ABT2J3H3_9PSEU|nr:Gfo/Idh/MocA family oxidoreductase [Actinophytocola gossypii]MCT2582403.1 Gfo/Idh/MocA family oxidoreductase [Actinophytocola gossypii]
MATYTSAIVGTGVIAGFHAASLERLGGRSRIVAATDIDPNALDVFADKWSVPGRYPDLDTLLAEESPDLVHLCTPPGLHAAQAVAALERGCHVLCEKPPVLSLAELDAISAAAGRARFATVFQHRFGSGAEGLRGLIGDPRLGRPTAAVCHTLWFRPDEYFAVPWRGNWDVEGGGPTMGHGIHQFDLLLSIMGDWREVVAVAARQAKPTATEDLSCAIVTFANGAVATVVNSVVSPREASYLRFDFEHATVELNHVYGYGDDDWTVTAAPGHSDEVAAAWAAAPTGVRSGHDAQLAAVLDALDAGVAPPVSLPDTRRTVELIAAIYASAFTGRRITAGELDADSPFYHRMDGSGAPWS